MPINQILRAKAFGLLLPAPPYGAMAEIQRILLLIIFFHCFGIFPCRAAAIGTTITVSDPGLMTSLRAWTDPGRHEGCGQVYQFTQVDGWLATLNDVEMTFIDSASGKFCSGSFTAPGAGPLTAGDYVVDKHGFDRGASDVGMTVSSPGMLAATGRFTVHEMSGYAAGTRGAGWVTFDADPGFFTGMHGEIKFHAHSSSITYHLPPMVTAYADGQIGRQGSAALSGSASDAQVPGGRLAAPWSKVEGSGAVTFADPSALQTTAKFSAGGSYLLRLTASDGQAEGWSEVVVTVVDAAEQTSLTLWDDWGEFTRYAPNTSHFSILRQDDDDSVVATLSDNDGLQSRLVFGASYYEPFPVGKYSEASVCRILTEANRG